MSGGADIARGAGRRLPGGRAQTLPETPRDRALAAGLRALAACAVDVDCRAAAPRLSRDRVALTGPLPLPLWRAQADSAACWLRFHDADAARRHAPAGGAARAFYHQLELARCEALGARRRGYAGVAANLRVAAAGIDAAALNETERLVQRLRRYLLALPDPAAGAGLDERARCERLYACLQRPAAFATAAAEWAAALGLDDAHDADAEPPPAVEAPQPQPDPDSDADAPRRVRVDVAARPPVDADAGAGAYSVYTADYDETVDATTLYGRGELGRLGARLRRHSLDDPTIARLAARLQRRLLAAARYSWRDADADGVLDPRRFAALIADPLNPQVFRREHATAWRDSVVTLLIDNSRSMRGWPIVAAAVCADVLARTLERCGVGCEILGYTTRSWRDGRARARWRADGAPPRPGRLTELRHIVYKSADMPWRGRRDALGVMLRVDLLKQNVDGEALLWAARRLRRRPERRRLLVVICDGAPVDESTLAAQNPPDLLERHLDAVIGALTRDGGVELAAIGIGHDVGRYYRNAVSVDGPEQLGSALCERLDCLFAPH